MSGVIRGNLTWIRSIGLVCLIIVLLVPLPAFAQETIQTSQQSNSDAPIRIAFIDTGISSKHFKEGQLAAGRNYVFPDKDSQDRDGHGTATAGMVLGSESLGLAGSCPQAQAVPLVTVDRYPSGLVKKADVRVMSQAIYDAIDIYGCRVINISMGVIEDNPELGQAVDYAEERGVVIVSAVGNDNIKYPERSYYPASYSTVIGVGAAEWRAEGSSLSGQGQTSAQVSGSWQVADFSQRQGLSVLAPGVNLATVTNKNALEPGRASGTSYASAYVAGLVAQILMDNPGLEPAEIRAILFAGADNLSLVGEGIESGWGLVERGQSVRDKLTRAVLVELLYEAAGRPEIDGDDSVFGDVPADSYYMQAVNWAASVGIVKGYNSSQFAPNNLVSREEMAVIIKNYASYQGLISQGLISGERASLSHFTDEGILSDRARAALSWAIDRGLFRGRGQGILDPLGATSRTETSLILERFFVNQRAF